MSNTALLKVRLTCDCGKTHDLSDYEYIKFICKCKRVIIFNNLTTV